MRKTHTIALCLIVRKENRHLERCLQSAQPAFDALYVTDAGASARALKVARQLGATIRPFAWHNNWAEARNHSIANVTEDWLLILHPEEVFKEGEARKLRSLVQSTRFQALTFECESVQGYTPEFPIRLVRNLPGLSFAGYIHEKPAKPPQLRRGHLPIRITRENCNDTAFKSNLKTNESLLKKELLRAQKTKDSLQCWVVGRDYGLACILHHQPQQASSLWSKMLAGLSPNPLAGHSEKLTAELNLLASAHWWYLVNGQEAAALALCQKFHCRFGKFLAFKIIHGFTLIRREQFADGLKILQAAEIPASRQLPEIPLPANHLTVDLWNYLGQAHLKLGHYDRALKYFKRCLEKSPASTEYKANLRLAELLKQSFGA